MGRSRPGPFPDRDVLHLQDHGCAVRYRNIWCRELPPRSVEGGTDGWLTLEATMAKRQQIAAAIRQDADRLRNPDHPVPEMLRRMESLEYEQQDATLEQVTRMAADYVAGLKQLPADKLGARKDEARQVRDAFQFLAKFKVLPAPFAPATALARLIEEQGWDKRRR